MAIRGETHRFSSKYAFFDSGSYSIPYSVAVLPMNVEYKRVLMKLPNFVVVRRLAIVPHTDAVFIFLLSAIHRFLQPRLPCLAPVLETLSPWLLL